MAMPGWLSNFLEPEGTPQFPRNAGWLAQLLQGGGYQPQIAPVIPRAVPDHMVPGGPADMEQGKAFGFPAAAEAAGLQFPLPGMFAGARAGALDIGTEPMPTAGMQPEPPKVASGPPTVTSLDGGGPIPLPRPRPREAQDISSRAVSRQAPGAPLSLEAPAPYAGRGDMGALSPVAPAAASGPSAALLMALGSGFAGAPSFGSGMRRAFGNAAPLMAQNEQQDRALNLKLQEQQLTQRALYDAFVKAGASREETIAALRDPTLRKELADKYFPKDSTAAPTTRERKLENGMIQQEEWDRSARAWKPLGGPVPGDKRDRALTINDIEKMSGEGQRYSQINDFHRTFKDKYGGYMSGTVGDMANTYGRNVPWASPDAKERAEWWQGYQMYKNKVRNEMFGSALTATESNEFMKADITPGMSPDVIRQNLARQQALLDRSIRRKADAAVKAGYPKESVYSAFGIDEKPKKAGAGGKTRGGITWGVIPEGGEDD